MEYRMMAKITDKSKTDPDNTAIITPSSQGRPVGMSMEAKTGVQETEMEK